MPNFPGVGVIGGVGSIPMLAARALQVQQAQAQAQVQAQAQAQALVQEAQMTLARRELIQREMVSRLVSLQNMRANQNPVLNPELLKRTLGRVQLPLPTVPIQAQAGPHSFASPTPNPIPGGSTGSPGQTSNVTNSIQEVDEVKSIHSEKSSPTPDVTSTVASVTNSVTNSGTIPSLAGLGNSLGNSPLGNFQLGASIQDSSNIQKLLLQKISQSQSDLNKDKLSGNATVFIYFFFFEKIRYEITFNFISESSSLFNQEQDTMQPQPMFSCPCCQKIFTTSHGLEVSFCVRLFIGLR